MKKILLLMIISLSLIACASNKPQVKQLHSDNSNQVSYQWGFDNSPIGKVLEYYRNKENDIPFVRAKILKEE